MGFCAYRNDSATKPALRKHFSVRRYLKEQHQIKKNRNFTKTKPQKMQINATITGLQYQVFLANELET
jgi:hypothetical protein